VGCECATLCQCIECSTSEGSNESIATSTGTRDTVEYLEALDCSESELTKVSGNETSWIDRGVSMEDGLEECYVRETRTESEGVSEESGTD
jgi:hypothetical protein